MFPLQFTTSLKVAWKTIIQIMIDFNKGPSSSPAVFKSILHVSQNVCHGEGLLIHVTVYNSAFF